MKITLLGIAQKTHLTRREARKQTQDERKKMTLKDETTEETTEETAGKTEEGIKETEKETTEKGTEEGVKDTHGQVGINKERHDREVKELNEQIAALKSQLEESAKNEESRKAFEAKCSELEAKMAESEQTHALEMAGCVNVKAAKAILADYKSVAELKEECPYLFGEKKGSVGGNPSGSAGKDVDELLDKAFGLKK